MAEAPSTRRNRRRGVRGTGALVAAVEREPDLTNDRRPARSRTASFTPRIVGQAWPVLFGQLSAMAYGVIDTVMTGHASPTDLAAMGLGAGIYGTVFLSLLGVIGALNPIIGQHYGAGRNTDIGASYVQGLWLSLVISVPGCVVLGTSDLWLAHVGAPPEVQTLVARYLRILSAALPAALMFRAVYALNVAVSRPKVVMALQVTGLLLKVVLSYVLIFGHLGLPRLGAVGCAVASLIVQWTVFALGAAYTRLDGWYGRFAIRRAGPRWAALKEQLGLGVPMGLAYAFESSSFTLIAVLVARLGTSVMGGNQVVMNLAALCFQIPLALAIATATVTAQAIGAGDVGGARRAAAAGMRLAFVIASLTALSMWMFRHAIVGLYTNDAAVAAVALSLIGYVAASHVFDALQGITAAVLRAYKIVVAPAVIFSVALWGVGVVGGYLVAFHPVLGAPRGAPGMWLMQAVALCLTSALLLALYLRVQSSRAGSGRAPRPSESVAA